MNSVYPHETLVRPVLTALTLLFLIAIGYTFRRHWRKPRRRKPSLYRCETCNRVYSDNRNVPLSACPGCGRLNHAARKR